MLNAPILISRKWKNPQNPFFDSRVWKSDFFFPPLDGGKNAQVSIRFFRIMADTNPEILLACKSLVFFPLNSE